MTKIILLLCVINPINLISGKTYKSLNDTVIVNGVNKEGFPFKAFSIIEDNQGCLWTSSEFGVYYYNRLSNRKVEWFDDKSEVLNIFKGTNKILFLHKTFELSLFKDNKFSLIPIRENSRKVNWEIEDLLNVQFDLAKEKIYFLFINHNLNNLNLYEFDIQTGESKLFDKNIPRPKESKLTLLFNKEFVKIFGQLFGKKLSIKAKIELNYHLRDSLSDSISGNITYFNSDILSYKLYHNKNDLYLVSIYSKDIFKLKFEGEISNITEDYEGNIWIATSDNGIWFFDLNLNENIITKIAEQEFGEILKLPNVTNIELYFSKKHGFFYNGFISNGYKHIYSNRRVHLIHNLDSITIGYEAIRIREINYSFKEKINDYCIFNNSIYLGLNSGLFEFNLKNYSLKKILSNQVSCIDVLDGKLIVSIKNALYRINEHGISKLLINFNDKILCFSVSINKICVSTKDGVFLIDNGSKRKISKLGQITNLFIYQNLLFMADSRFIYYKELRYNLIKKKILLSVIISKSKFKNGVHFLENRNLSINSFFKSSYNSNSKLRIIIISKKDTVFNIITSSGLVSFNNLKSGDYKLILFGENDIGVSSERMQYKLHIKPMIYEKFEFKVAITILIVLLLYSFFRLAIRMQRKNMIKKNLELQVENFQLQLLRSQLNPHFLFNSLNSLKSLVYNKSIEDALLYIDNISKFLREILNSNNKSITELAKEIEVINHYIEIENLRLENRIKFNLEIDKSLLNVKIPANILQPIIENCIKYGGIKNEIIEIEMRCYLSIHLVIEIVNNSIELNYEKKSNSFSLEAIKKRIELHNKSNKIVALELKEISEANRNIGVKTILRIIPRNE